MLQGSFDTFDFAEVLGMLARKRQTGKLRLHSGPSAVDLFLSEGRLVHAESSDSGGSVRVADSRARLEEACVQVMRWDHGSFEFHPGSAPGTSRGLDATVEGVLNGARKRLEEWERVMSVVPTLDVQPRLAPRLDRAEVTIGRDAWRVLAAIDGRRNGHALCRTLGLSSYELSQILSTLVGDGLIDIGNRPKVAIAPRVAGPSGRQGSVRLPEQGPGGPAEGPSEQPAASPAGGQETTATDAGQEQAPAADERKVPAGSLMKVSSRLRIRPANS